MNKEFILSVTVYNESPDAIAKAGEVLARACVGLALEGVRTSITVGPLEEDDD